MGLVKGRYDGDVKLREYRNRGTHVPLSRHQRLVARAQQFNSGDAAKKFVNGIGELAKSVHLSGPPSMGAMCKGRKQFVELGRSMVRLIA